MKRHVWMVWLAVLTAVFGVVTAFATGDADEAADDTADNVFLGEQDLAERMEIWRNQYRRMTPGDAPLVQDVGTWPAAWEEFSRAWDAAPAERDLATWLVPVVSERTGSLTVLRDADGNALWSGATDFAKEGSESVTLTGTLVSEEEWVLWQAARGEIDRRLGLARPPRLRDGEGGGGGTNGLCMDGIHFVSAEADFTPNPPELRVGLQWTNTGTLDVFAYGPLHTSDTHTVTYTNDENQVITVDVTNWHYADEPYTGLGNAWEWLGTVAIPDTNPVVFIDTNFPPERGKVRYYAAAETVDSDGDGLNDGFEMYVSHSKTNSADGDNDGVDDATEYAAGANPAISNSFWVVITTNSHYERFSMGWCNVHAPTQFVADWTIIGNAPTPSSIVSNVTVTGFVDDNIKVDGNGVNFNRGPKRFTNWNVTGSISNLQSRRFNLALWDWPADDFYGFNEAKIGWTNTEEFLVKWTWLVPMGLVGPDIVRVGDTVQLVAQGGISGEPYAWSVDSGIATIDSDGLLTATTAGVVRVSAEDASGCEASKDVTIVQIAFLTNNANMTSSLKIGKWENAFDLGPTVKSNFIDVDPDCFCVQVTDPSQAGAGETSLTLSTTKPWSAQDDNPTTITLDEQPVNSGVFMSQNLLLVADDIDDDFNNSAVPPDDSENDRTHRIVLGGQVEVRYPAVEASFVKADVPVQSEASLHVIPVILRDEALSDGGTPVAETWDVVCSLLVAKERFYQLGINLTWDPPSVSDPPAGVDLSDGLTARISAAPHALANEAKAAIEGVGTVGDLTDIHIVFVNAIEAEGVQIGGISVADYWFDSSANDYLYNIFMTPNNLVEWSGCSIAHELGHLLTDFGTHATNSWQIMHNGIVLNGVTGSRRFVSAEETAIKGNPHVQ